MHSEQQHNADQDQLLQLEMQVRAQQSQLLDIKKENEQLRAEKNQNAARVLSLEGTCEELKGMCRKLEASRGWTRVSELEAELQEARRLQMTQETKISRCVQQIAVLKAGPFGGQRQPLWEASYQPPAPRGRDLRAAMRTEPNGPAGVHSPWR